MREPDDGAVVFFGDRFLERGERAAVDVRDRAYLLGDSVFATLRAFGGAPFALERHLARLTDAAAATGIALPSADLAGVVREACLRLGARDATVRVTVGRGAGPWGIGLEGPFSPSLSVVARETRPYAPELYARGVDAAVLATRRVPRACLPPEHKTGSYLPTVLARRELAPGAVEGVQLSVEGFVSSGTISNLFAVIDGRVVTPSLAHDARPGVTREVLLELAPRARLEIAEVDLTPRDLARASEVFFTSTLMDGLPVRALAGVPLSGRFDVATTLRGLLLESQGRSAATS